MIRIFVCLATSLFFTAGAHAQLKIFDVNQVADMPGVAFSVTGVVVGQPNLWLVNQNKDVWMVRQFEKSDLSAQAMRGVVVRPANEKSRFKSVLSLKAIQDSGPELNFSYYTSSKGSGSYLDCRSADGCVHVTKGFCQQFIEQGGGPRRMQMVASQCGALALQIRAAKLSADEFSSAKEAIKSDLKELLSSDASLGKRATGSVDKLTQADAMAPNNMMRTVDACLAIYERRVSSEGWGGYRKADQIVDGTGGERDVHPAAPNPTVDIPAEGFIDEHPAAKPPVKKIQ